MLKNQQGLQGRQYFLDWVRVLAFAYLIFFHTGMMFVSWGFHIESGHAVKFLEYMMSISHVWRIALLFLVSGVAISFMTRKTAKKAFVKERMLRLAVPLIFAVCVVVAPQVYFEALQKGFIEEGFIRFWAEDYFSFTWIEGMISPMPVYNHMWYVLYLLIYTMVLLPVFYYFNTEQGLVLLSRFEAWLVKGYRLLWLPTFAFMTTKLTVGAYFQESHALVDDWWIHADSIMIILLGFIFVRMPMVWVKFEDTRWLSFAVAILSGVALLVIIYSPDTYLPASGNRLYLYTFPIVKWSWVAMIIGMARHYLNRPSATLTYCNKAVYPFFILHQTVTIMLGFYAINWGMGVAGEFWTIALGTFVICWILYEGIIRHFGLTRLVFGMRS